MSTWALDIRALRKDYRLPGKKSFSALGPLDLRLEQGQVLGLIGHNGAGKSTLLKILSRITPPSAGEIQVRGSLASLLEVGTGFHPELSGRDNIYLNGSILGMSKAEIRAQFEAIVDFAGVSQFLDMPVKRYSSGMYVRLAFAVAAHLRADILLIDEVLAVGDAAFQKKCLGRMDDLRQEEGRSIIFVSHNLTAISGLCSEVALLEKGQLQALGPAEKVIESYLSGLASLHEEIPLAERRDRQGDGRGKILRISSGRQAADEALYSGEDAFFELELEAESAGVQSIGLELHIFNSRGHYLSSLQHQQSRAGASMSWRCYCPQLALMPGRFFLNAHLYLDGQRADYVGRAYYFTVLERELSAGEIALQRQNPGVYLRQTWQ